MVLDTDSQHHSYILNRSLSGTRSQSPPSNNKAACLPFFTSLFEELYLGAKSSDRFDKFLLLCVQHK